MGRVSLLDILDSISYRLNSDSTIEFIQVMSLDTIRPDDAFELAGTDEQRRIAVADFPLRGLGEIAARVSVKEILGSVVPESGGKVRLEPFFAGHETDVVVGDVVTADIVGGAIVVSFSNYTTIRFDSVVIGTQAGEVKFGVAKPGETHMARLTIGACRIASPTTIRFAMWSPGTGPESVVVSGVDSLVVRVLIDSVHLGAGRLRLPHAQVARRCPIRLVSAKLLRIDRLEIERGQCEIAVTNGLNVPVLVRFSVPQLGTSAGCKIERKSSACVRIDLRGLVVDNGGQINSPVWLCATATIPQDSGWIDVGKDDAVDFNYIASGLRPRTIAGCFREPVYVSSQTRQMSVAPLGMRGIRVSHITMVLELENRVGFPIEILANLQAIRGARVIRVARHSLVLEPSPTGQLPATKRWVIPMEELVNTGSDSIRWECSYRISGEGCFESGSFVAGSGLVSSPFRMAMEPDTITLPCNTVNLKGNGLERFMGKLESAFVLLTIANHFPIPLSGRVILLGSRP
ncbi:MAG: hypothetical protein ABIK43_00895, partial [candidate division WOR-3 bacterium]